MRFLESSSFNTCRLSLDQGSPILSSILINCAPKYYFSFSGQQTGSSCVQTPPHRNLAPSVHVSRFVSLSAFDNGEKAKFVYAFKLDPQASFEASDAIENPFIKKLDAKRLRDDSEYAKPSKPLPPGYICRKCGIPGHFIRECPEILKERKSKQPKKTNFDKDHSCWFCLGNPKAELHLVVAVGDHSYVALSKGPTHDLHCLVIPIEHVASLSALSQDALREIQEFKKRIHKLFSSKDCIAVFVEVFVPREGRESVSHAVLQAYPIQKQFPESIVKKEFDKMAIESKLTWKSTQFEDLLSSSYGYIYMEFGMESRISEFDKDIFVPMNCMRDAICKILKSPNKRNWKECTNCRDEEERLASIFKKDL